MKPIQLTQERYDAGELLPGVALPPITRFLETRIESHDTDKAVIRISYGSRPEYANPHNFVNGGILSAMMDDAMNCLILAQNGGTRQQVSTDLHTSFFKPVVVGPRIRVEARIDRMGRSVAFTSAVVLNDTGEVLAKSVHTAAFLPPAPGKGG